MGAAAAEARLVRAGERDRLVLRERERLREPLRLEDLFFGAIFPPSFSCMCVCVCLCVFCYGEVLPFLYLLLSGRLVVINLPAGYTNSLECDELALYLLASRNLILMVTIEKEKRQTTLLIASLASLD